MVEEILLELVEQDQDGTGECLGGLAQQIIKWQRCGDGQRLLPRQLHGLETRGFDCRQKISRLPLAKNHNRGARLVAQVGCDARQQDRALADTTFAVKHRQR